MAKRYIDADKLIEHIKDLPTWWEDEGGVYGHSMKYPEGLFHCEDVINSIENAPTADVKEVKNGEWEQNGRCTCCGAFSVSHGADYCSNCGADMRGDTDG